MFCNLIIFSYDDDDKQLKLCSRKMKKGDSGIYINLINVFFSDSFMDVFQKSCK